MTTPRFVSRHVHQTLADHIFAHLQTLGWGNADLPADDPVNAHVNFGGRPCTYMTVQPEEVGEPLVPNMVAVTLGGEPGAMDAELGSERGTLDFPVFVDVYGDHQSVTDSILDDVRYGILDNLFLIVEDYSTTPPTPTTVTIEVDRQSIEKRKPDATIGAENLKRNWRVVVATAHVDNLWT